MVIENRLIAMGYIEKNLEELTERDYDIAMKILNRIRKDFETKPASANRHLAEVGGLAKHTANVMMASRDLYSDIDKMFELPFTLGDLLFMAFIHDIGKIRVYKEKENGRGFEYYNYGKFVDHVEHTKNILLECGIMLTTEQFNALEHHHGGWSKYQGQPNKMAYILHCADLIASQIMEEL